MCRLFGLNAGRHPVSATFWLLDAPDSLRAQSHRNVDGSGIGFFDATAAPVLDKQPEPAFRDREFTREAKRAESVTFVAHVRQATAGGRTTLNTHPFAMRGRIMAHNGGFGELSRLDAQLGEYASLVLGDTDSERYFALITQQADAHGGDVTAGITAAARWIAAHLPVTALNIVVTAPGELWALRYPDQHALHVIERPAGPGQHRSGLRGVPGHRGIGGIPRPAECPPGSALAGVPGGRPPGPAPPGLHLRSATSSFHMPALASAPSVVVASERLDGESGWRMLAPGELMHVRPDLSVESAVVITDPPARLVPLGKPDPGIDT